MSFRRNVINGRTDSIDEDWDYARHLNIIPDGTNNRWRVNDGCAELGDIYMDDAMIETHSVYASDVE